MTGPRRTRPFAVIHVTDRGRSVIDHLAEWLTEERPGTVVSRAALRRLVMAGQVRLNGRGLRAPGAPLLPGDRLEWWCDPATAARPHGEGTPSVAILYEDPHVLVVDKPSGLAMHATADPRRPTLVGVLAQQLGCAPHELGVHQRLDAGTSGVVVFGRSPEANRGLSQQFTHRLVEKTYLAVADARRRPDCRAGQAWVESRPLRKRGTGRAARVEVDVAQGEPAETHFRIRARQDDHVLVEARPVTGRTHQIRAHLAAVNLPIVGDIAYGWRGAPGRLRLHAVRLALQHPVTLEPLVFEAPVPAECVLGTGGRTGDRQRPLRVPTGGRKSRAERERTR